MAVLTRAETMTSTTFAEHGRRLWIQDEDEFKTEAYYLVKDPKHEFEKPYEIRYDTGTDIPHSNISNESRQITVRNFRALEDLSSFDEYGFATAMLSCPMTIGDFQDDDMVEAVYYPAVKQLLRQRFPDASEIGILEHGYRQRHPNFPKTGGDRLEYTQPATLVHIDFTLESATRNAKAAFKFQPGQYRRLLTVNLWKSLKPGNDWPLALCDRRTTDPNTGSIGADVVFHNRYTENNLVYFSPKHELFYFKDLKESEVILFKQTDSVAEGGGGVPHISCFNPTANKDAPPRASMELRAYVFFK